MAPDRLALRRVVPRERGGQGPGDERADGMSALSPVRLPLARARAIAEKVVDALRDHCLRIEIAGSIRRGRPECGDVDLVCVPKPGGREAMIERCKRSGTMHKFGEQYVVIELANGFQLDLWC